MTWSTARDAARTRVALLAAACCVALTLTTPSSASATTVVFCNFYWPSNGTRCPNGLPARHSYTAGNAASAAGVGTLYAEWYVAAPDSNAVTPKYVFHTNVGNVLSSPIGNNTQYLRAYAYVVNGGAGGGGNLYSEGSY